LVLDGARWFHLFKCKQAFFGSFRRMVMLKCESKSGI
jgi:hypothetical protein